MFGTRIKRNKNIRMYGSNIKLYSTLRLDLDDVGRDLFTPPFMQNLVESDFVIHTQDERGVLYA